MVGFNLDVEMERLSISENHWLDLGADGNSSFRLCQPKPRKQVGVDSAMCIRKTPLSLAVARRAKRNFTVKKKKSSSQSLPTDLMPPSLFPCLEFSRARGATSSLEVWRDLKSLKGHLKRSKLRAPSYRRQASASVKQRRRKLALETILGGEKKYREVLSLVQKVQSLKGAALLVSGNADNKIAPSAARDLLFRVSLVHAFQSAPVELIVDLPWDEMIRECQSILDRYCLWQHDKLHPCC